MKDQNPISKPGDSSLAERITEVYWRRVKDTGLGEAQDRALRSDLEERVGKCLDHFEVESPEKVTDLKRMLERYDRLRKAAGLSRGLLEEPSRLLPGIFGHIQAVIEAALGVIPALIGLITGILPFLAASWYAKRTGKTGIRQWEKPQFLVAVLVFLLFYALLTGVIAWNFSDQATIAFALLLITTGLFTLAYKKRMRTIVAHLGDRTASWFKLGAVARVRKAQDEIVDFLDLMRNEYRQEVLGWKPLRRHSRPKATRSALARLLVIILAAVGIVMFFEGYREKPIQGLPLGPSRWQVTRTSDPEQARRELLRDANGVLIAARQLDDMQQRMAGLRSDFHTGKRSFLNQEDQDEFRSLQIAYLDLRAMLLKAIWLYRGDKIDQPGSKSDDLDTGAFLTAYTAAALLTEKAWLIYDRYRDEPEIRKQLDLGDLAWKIPPHTYTNIVTSLTNRSAMAELQLATRRFESDLEAERFPNQYPWTQLADRAKQSLPALEHAFAGVGKRALDRAVVEMQRQIREPANEVTPVVSVTVSRFRFKERPPHRGLVSPAQLEELRSVLKPGDILIERRNWYISNCVLPGFWPHAALYLGSYQQLADLGVPNDPRAAPHMSAFRGQDARGNDYAVVEAIGEGVIFTSFEHSVGESDAVVVLRPVLSDEDLRDSLGRALSHRGKEYDFDFDFETPDRLVCTELIFRTYDPILKIPEMRTIAGKKRISASDYVRMWADGRRSGKPQLELVRFFDFDEANGVAVEADEETLIETLDRSRFTFMK